MSTRWDDNVRPADAVASINARLVAANEELVLNLIDAQERAETGTRLLEDMARSMAPDVLTGLPGRAALLDRLTQALKAARLNGHGLAVLAVQLDNFPHVVTERGAAFGNAILKLMAGQISAVFGTVETVSRHGPHGFIVVLPELRSGDTEGLNRRLASGLDVPHVSVRVGGAFFPGHGKSPLELIDSAEAAVQSAARNGERSLVIFDRSMAHAHRPAALAAADLPGRSEKAFHGPERSPLLTYLRDANEKLLLASVASLDQKEHTEKALRRHMEFLAELGHELRTPLTAVSMASAMMRDVEPGEIPRLQGVIDRQIVQMSRLLSDLIDVSRISTGKVILKRERVTVGSILRQAIDTCMPAIEARGQVLAAALPQMQIDVFGDSARLVQIFIHLLDNASKYTPEGGGVDVYVVGDDTSVTVTVKDTGIGISAAALPHIFEPFVHGRGPFAFSGMGLGVGLTMVRETVEAHGGHVEACSSGANTGSSFIVTLGRMAAARSTR